jgi:hypothetical protein
MNLRIYDLSLLSQLSALSSQIFETFEICYNQMDVIPMYSLLIY